MPQSEGGYKLFKIGELFDIHPTKAYKLTNAELFVEGGKNPVVSNSSVENGIGGFSNLPTTEEGNMITFSDTTTSDAIFYQPHPFVGYPHVQGLYPIKYKDKWNEKTLLYVMSIFRKCAQGRFDYATKFTRVIALEMPLLLPVDHAGEIDFDFIESRVRELEEERVRELEAYLRVSNFSDCSLTLAEKKAIETIKDFKTIPVSSLFEKPSLSFKRKVFNKKNDISTQKTNEFNLPLVNAKHGQNGIMYYGREQDFDSIEMGIDIVNDGAVSTGDVYPQPQKTGVLYNAYLIKFKNFTPTDSILMFMSAVIEKAIKLKFSYQNKAGWEKVKDCLISVPITADGSIDYAYMENYINAIKKQTIAHVKEYIEREHNAYMRVIQSEEPSGQTITPLVYPEYKPGRIPLYTIRAACGHFGEGRLPEEEGWIDASSLGFTPDPKRHFAVHAKGDSMLPKIKDGDICVFEWYSAGSRNGEIVLTQISELDDAYDGRYTIKRYHSEKTVTDEGWQHSKVELQPLNPDFEPIQISEDGDFRTIGILKCVL